MINNKYSIRRDALISPWGIGAIAPFPNDESLMIAGLDHWFMNGFDYHDFIIVDERLSKRLNGKEFVFPPDFRKPNEDKDHAEMRIPSVRFPLWHYCPVCGNMEKLGDAGDKKRCSGENRRRNGKETSCSKKAAKGSKRMPLLIPERFITVCENGHIEDFPVMEWVHAKSDKTISPNCKLFRTTGGTTSSLAGVRYTCTCGASASMQGAFFPNALDDIGYRCTGNEPWLGHNVKNECGKTLKVLQRGASNVWFADIINSIYIPISAKNLNENTKKVIAKGISKFKSSLTDGQIDLDTIKQFVENASDFYDNVDKKSAVNEIIEELSQCTGEEKDISEDEYRKQEYDVLIDNFGTPEEELYVKRYSSSEYNNIPFLNGISLVHKLRETRVFTGFRRLDPSAPKKADISVNEISWLPAVKNSGEGIMFEFDISRLNKWATKENAISRVSIIEANLKNNNKLADEKINPIYVLLHTFAHCLITALSNESGYSNASIREKIYCPKYIEENPIQMAGILIYTASGDSEGSLGGLVRQGKPGFIENIITRAIAEAEWCASDPVCIQSPGQGQDGCNLAACHNCALLPETSCENKNMLLDRGLLVGTLSDPDLGFFGV